MKARFKRQPECSWPGIFGFRGFGFVSDFGFRFSVFRPLLVLFAFNAVASFAAIPSGWNTNLTEALARATEKRQPVLVWFTAEWCGPCKMMANGPLKDATTVEALGHFQCAAVDIDLAKETAQELGIGSVPTFVILEQNGDEVDRSSGYMEAGLFRAWLAAGVARFERAQIQRQKDLEQQRRIAADLQGADANRKAKALGELFELCARREQSHQKFAREQMRQVAARAPALLLPALNHPRLATRIQAANLLKETFGEAFTFDPWNPPAARAQALAELEKKLPLPRQP